MIPPTKFHHILLKDVRGAEPTRKLLTGRQTAGRLAPQHNAF